MVTLEPMTAADIPQAIALWKRCEGIVLRDADSPEALARYLVRNPGSSFVARSDGQFVGVALAGHDGRRGYLHHMAVAAEFRRRGIGRQLANACLESLLALGIEKCILFVVRGNQDATAFWEKLGWVVRDEVQMMSINLSSSPNA